MKGFKDIITLSKNSRGCYILDPIKGCSVCGTSKPSGCYDDCYAKRISDRYGIDFANVIERKFIKSYQYGLFEKTLNLHADSIVNEIKNIPMPFVRMGEMGDPSERWEHTINICKEISRAGKPIVIITKHWKPIPEKLLKVISDIDICINTSVSALDSEQELKHRLYQYERLKPYCNSVLRIVSCDFNLNNEEGAHRNNIQNELLKIEPIIDTVFRPSKSNRLILDGIINVKKVKFLRSTMLASMHNVDTYLGICDTCPDMCGINFRR